MDRLDENVKEEADGIHNSLGNDQIRSEQFTSFHFNYHSHRGEHDRIATNALC